MTIPRTLMAPTLLPAQKYTRYLLPGFLSAFFLFLSFSPFTFAQDANNDAEYARDAIWVIDIHGAIGPVTMDHFSRGLETAVEHDARFVVLRMDTPGGLDKSMRDIIKNILSSPIPIVTYVAPNGARAASAGTYILYASHIAAMAPATNVGAATPVAVGSPAGSPPTGEGEPEQVPSEDSMKNKMINDAVAYIVSLAELRDRNKEWAAAAVKGAESISAPEALAKNVINLVAEDLEGLLQQLHDYKVALAQGEVTLQTENAATVYYEADWRNKFLAVITDQSIAYILLLIGIYGLVLEFYSPGTIGPGVIGAICLLIAMYALQMLPINYVGVALILLGLGLMVAEAMAPSLGILGLGGVVSFVIGSIILVDTKFPAYQIAMPVILAFTTISVVFMIVIVSMLLRIRRKASVSGMEAFVGKRATVEEIYNGKPKIRLEGELWYVTCDEPLQLNDRVEVVQAKDVVLDVKKIAS